MRTRVKICGITRIEDALAAARAGADAIGLVFWPKTPRVVSFEQAKNIVAFLPPFVTVVGLFVDPHADEVRASLAAVATPTFWTGPMLAFASIIAGPSRKSLSSSTLIVASSGRLLCTAVGIVRSSTVE